MSCPTFIGLPFSGLPLIGFLAWLLLTSPAVARERGADGPPASLTATVSETADTVRVRVQVLGEIEPGSLEVGFEGRKAIISARDAGGRPIRAARVQLPAQVMEDGATAQADSDDVLVITLRKQRTAAPSTSDLDSAR